MSGIASFACVAALVAYSALVLALLARGFRNEQAPEWSQWWENQDGGIYEDD